jgi:hypothetical protein
MSKIDTSFTNSEHEYLIMGEMFNENDQTIVEQITANLHEHARCPHEPFY